MTAVTFAEHDGEPVEIGADQRAATAESSRRWRSVWRIHFYSGMLAMPFILFMAVTGLVILYTQPIHDLTEGDLRTVDPSEQVVSLDDQAAAVATAFAGDDVLSATVPVDQGHSTAFAIDDGSPAGRTVFVDPHTGEVLGSTNPDGGVVGLANRLHGSLNNDAVTLALPTMSALWDGGPAMRDYVIGDLVLELAGIWTLVLVASGMYLWWPRGTRRFGVRRGVSGRARWRDLHGVTGAALLGMILITVMSGLAWSTYWGPHFSSIADHVTPSTWVDAPPSAVGERGDLDRLGNQINWNIGDRPIPASYATPGDGRAPAAIRLDDIAAIATTEGMQPGYTIHFPSNAVDDPSNPVYGAFTLSNSWPRKTGESRDVYLDQFTGATLGERSAADSGGVSRAMDTLVSTHMGTQLGIASRVMMTALCVLAIFSVISGFAMFWKRRRPGTAGLPRRPVDVKLSRNLAVVMGVMAVVFPLWAVTAAAVLALDRFVIRKRPHLRTAFGQPA